MSELNSDFGLDPAIAAELAAMGTALDMDVITRCRELFAPSQDDSLPDGGTRLDDLAYGDHPRHLIDICTPGMTGRRPVLLFVHGGGFTGGDKGFYRHIPAFFARSGFVAAALNYRLAPDHVWPAGSEDVAQALDWLHGNAEHYGGDPERIFVVAQSAGAAHASAALFNPALQPACIDKIRAVILMSGVYHMTADSIVLNGKVYYGEDPALYPERSAVTHVLHGRTPVYLTLAQYDPAYLADTGLALMVALSHRDGNPPPLTWLKGHNHLSPVQGLGGPDDRLGPAMASTLLSHM